VFDIRVLGGQHGLGENLLLEENPKDKAVP
jgi:hypothetical protein